MGKYLNIIIAIVILVIVTAVCSNYFYRKGQKDTWAAAQQLVPLEKGEVYLCVEETDNNGISFLTVKEISSALKEDRISQKDLRLRIKMALNGLSLKEYNEKFKN